MASQINMQQIQKDLLTKSGKNLLEKEAHQLLSEKGFPTKKLEDWHYTSPKEALELVTYSEMKAEISVDPEVLKRIQKAQQRIVFVGSQLDLELSNVQAVKTDLSSEVLKDGMQAAGALVSSEQYQIQSQNLSAETLHLFYIGVIGQFSSSSLEVIVQSGHPITLISEVLDSSKASSVVIPRIAVRLEASAQCHWIHLQEQSKDSYQYSYLDCFVLEKSRLHFLGLSLGGKQVRNDIQVHINGPEADVVLDGVALGQGQQHFDQTTGIHHHSGGSQSSQTYKSILDGQSRSAFSGTVFIAKDAQKANSEQINHNLLLSDQAEADSRPMLKIYADDVKAGHGSTVGQISSEELFYLQSRAISKKQATQMLAYGFAAEVILKLESAELRQMLEAKLQKKFQELSQPL